MKGSIEFVWRSVFRLLLLLTPLVLNASSFQEVVSVEAVNVFLTAQNGSGDYVRDLSPGEITILENGVPQRVLGITNLALNPSDSWSGKDVPLSVAFAVDISASMAGMNKGQVRLDIAKSAILLLQGELKEKDRMMLTTFGRFPRILTEMISDKRTIENLLLSQQPHEDKTALFDSLSVVLERLTTESGRKILVLCTDGEDNSSQMTLDGFLERIASTDVLVLAFTVPSSTSFKNDYAIKKIAEVTGGFAFFPASVKELNEILEKLRQAMRNQYSLWYQPNQSSKDGSWRNIQVLCSRPGVQLHHRPGYYAR